MNNLALPCREENPHLMPPSTTRENLSKNKNAELGEFHYPDDQCQQKNKRQQFSFILPTTPPPVDSVWETTTIGAP